MSVRIYIVYFDDTSLVADSSSCKSIKIIGYRWHGRTFIKQLTSGYQQVAIMKVGHSIAVRNTIHCTTLITGQRLQWLAASWTFNWIQKRYIHVDVLLAFISDTLLFPIPRLLRVTFFFLWSVVWFDAVTVRPWYMKVELFRSFWNFFISGALADGAYLEKRNKFYLNRVQKSQFYSLPSGQVAHVQCR